MSFADLFKGKRDEFDGSHHASITHEVLGGAIAYEAAKAWENHCAKNGKPDNHAKAKEVIAGLVGGVATGLIESKGLNAWDDYKRKQALKHAEDRITETIVVKEY